MFRLPSGVAAPPGFSSKSDRIASYYLGLNIDKPYAQQRFQLDLNNTATRFDNLSSLDFDAFQYRGAWLWYLTPRVHGTLSEERRQYLVPYSDFRGFQRNIRTTHDKVLNVDAWIVGNWHLLAGVSRYDTTTSLPFVQESDYSADTAEVGAQYAATSGNTITLLRRSARGDYINQPVDFANLIDNHFDQDETEARTNWRTSGHSLINARLTERERRHPHFSVRNFSGVAGELNYRWTPAGKLRLDFVARRDIDSWVDLGSTTANSTYRVTDTLSISPTWQVGPRTAVRAALTRQTIDYRGAIGVDPRPVRNDHIRSALLGIEWTPRRFLSLSATARHDVRDSNNPGFEFVDTMAILTASLKF